MSTTIETQLDLKATAGRPKKRFQRSATARRLPGSYRDPSGQVFAQDGRIFRTVNRFGAAAYRAVANTGFLDTLARRGDLVGFWHLEDEAIRATFPDAVEVLEHQPLDYVSYPYEWSFPLLRAAALLHLDIMLEALDSGIALSDASAYNVQFDGARPVFIDHLSFRPYQDGEYWLGQRQFCEQFLVPLLLRSIFDIPHNAWMRGAPEGIPLGDLTRLLGLRHKLSLRMLTHVVLPARFQERAGTSSNHEARPIANRRGLSRMAYRGLLEQLKRWIGGLRPRSGTSVWGDYARENTYSEDQARKKHAFVTRFISQTGPRQVFDLGCNTGEYSETALKAGAVSVVGFDFDQVALEKAYQRSVDRDLKLLPLFLDGANPSPDQGWRQGERPGFAARARPDALLALAFIHHLAIGRNVPLDGVVDWLLQTAPSGVIEFVGKDDPTTRTMLALRDDIFPDYTRDAFEALLGSRSRIVAREDISSSRTLYAYTPQD